MEVGLISGLSSELLSGKVWIWISSVRVRCRNLQLAFNICTHKYMYSITSLILGPDLARLELCSTKHTLMFINKRVGWSFWLGWKRFFRLASTRIRQGIWSPGYIFTIYIAKPARQALHLESASCQTKKKAGLKFVSQRKKERK